MQVSIISFSAWNFSLIGLDLLFLNPIPPRGGGHIGLRNMFSIKSSFFAQWWGYETHWLFVYMAWNYWTRHLTATNVEFFFQRQGWETYLYAPVVKNKSFSWKYGYRARQKKQKKYLFLFWGVHTDPLNLGSAQKSENSSTLGRYCTVNKTFSNFLLVTIQEPLTRPFENTPCQGLLNGDKQKIAKGLIDCTITA